MLDSVLGPVGLFLGNLGIIGTVFIPILALIIPEFKFSSNTFLIGMSISLWLNTFFMNGLSSIGKINSSTRDIEKYTYYIRNQSSNLRNKAYFDLIISFLKYYIVKLILFSFFVGIPLFCSIYPKIIDQEKAIISLIPLLFYVYYIILSLVEVDNPGYFIICGILSIISVLFLWYSPYFHPYKIVANYLITGELIIVGLSKT